MTPKIDTLNIAYFIPGIVLTVAIALGVSEFESPLAGLTNQMPITKGAVFLGLSYVVGYAMWALGDILCRRGSDKLIGTHMLYYICIEKRMRTRFIQICERLELTKLTALLDSASSALVDDFACEEALECFKKIKEKDMGWWWWVLGLKRYAWLQTIFTKLGIDVKGAAGRVRAIAWDESYNRKNEYHIGRFLSSWNNVKFAKATMCSLLLGGAFYAACSLLKNWRGGFSGGKALIIGSYMGFGIAYFWIVNWRLRAFARDLVHGLAPNTENANSGGLAMTYDDVMTTVRDSEFDDWLLDDERGIFTLRNDLDVRIERRDPDDLLASYSEPWANNHSDPNATRVYFDIYYRSSFVETFMLVYVDGARACLPYPDAGTTIIPYGRYQLARAVDHQDKLDEYIQRSGLTVAKA